MMTMQSSRSILMVRKNDMVDFNKITWSQILVLFKTLKTIRLADSEYVERRYNIESINFRETLNFLIEIKLISVRGKRILLSRDARKVLFYGDDKLVKGFFLKKLFINNEKRIDLFEDYFKNFVLFNNLFVFKPNLAARLKYSGIRNFLLDLGALDFNYKDKSYTLKDWISKFAMDPKRNISYNEFIKQKKAANEIGNKAEIEIFELEKERLKDYPDFQRKIERVSLNNVAAGYDIKSYRVVGADNLIEKYIEVKAVSIRDWHFYWSANELDKAEYLSENYFLYLLPVSSNGIFEISKLQEIKNPYSEVYKNQCQWRRKIELISFERNESQ